MVAAEPLTLHLKPKVINQPAQQFALTLNFTKKSDNEIIYELFEYPPNSSDAVFSLLEVSLSYAQR